MPGCGEYDNIDVIFIDDKNYNEKNIIKNILYFNTDKNNRGMHWKNVLKMSPIYFEAFEAERNRMIWRKQNAVIFSFMY